MNIRFEYQERKQKKKNKSYSSKRCGRETKPSHKWDISNVEFSFALVFFFRSDNIFQMLIDKFATCKIPEEYKCVLKMWDKNIYSDPHTHTQTHLGTKRCDWFRNKIECLTKHNIDYLNKYLKNRMKTDGLLFSTQYSTTEEKFTLKRIQT